MPKPKKNEKRSDYLARAIKEMMTKEGMPHTQAVGKAMGMFTYYRKKKKK